MKSASPGMLLNHFFKLFLKYTITDKRTTTTMIAVINKGRTGKDEDSGTIGC